MNWINKMGSEMTTVGVVIIIGLICLVLVPSLYWIYDMHRTLKKWVMWKNDRHNRNN